MFDNNFIIAGPMCVGIKIRVSKNSKVIANLFVKNMVLHIFLKLLLIKQIELQ